MTTSPARIRWSLVASIAIAAVSLADCSTSNPFELGAQSAARAGERLAGSGPDNLYFAASHVVDAFEYPSFKKIAQLEGFEGNPEALCSDVRGDVFAAIRVNKKLNRDEVVEYSPGTTMPVAKLMTVSEPSSCSVDPRTGNLAVTVRQVSNGPTGVEVFQNASGPYTVYSDNTIFASGCGYDDKGDLFISGANASEKYVIAELPFRGKAFINAATPSEIADSLLPMHTMLWDGSYMTVGTVGATYGARTYYVYRFSVVNKAVKIRSTVSAILYEVDDQFGDESYFAIDGNIAAVTTNLGRVASYTYPAGGNQVRISRQLGYDNGAPIVFAPPASPI
jgi:hypothetical protein